MLIIAGLVTIAKTFQAALNDINVSSVAAVCDGSALGCDLGRRVVSFQHALGRFLSQERPDPLLFR
jgi:hypothetical protein